MTETINNETNIQLYKEYHDNIIYKFISTFNILPSSVVCYNFNSLYKTSQIKILNILREHILITQFNSQIEHYNYNLSYLNKLNHTNTLQLTTQINSTETKESIFNSHFFNKYIANFTNNNINNSLTCINYNIKFYFILLSGLIKNYDNTIEKIKYNTIAELVNLNVLKINNNTKLICNMNNIKCLYYNNKNIVPDNDYKKTIEYHIKYFNNLSYLKCYSDHNINLNKNFKYIKNINVKYSDTLKILDLLKNNNITKLYNITDVSAINNKMYLILNNNINSKLLFANRININNLYLYNLIKIHISTDLQLNLFLSSAINLKELFITYNGNTELNIINHNKLKIITLQSCTNIGIISNCIKLKYINIRDYQTNNIIYINNLPCLKKIYCLCMESFNIVFSNISNLKKLILYRIFNINNKYLNNDIITKQFPYLNILKLYNIYNVNSNSYLDNTIYDHINSLCLLKLNYLYKLKTHFNFFNNDLLNGINTINNIKYLSMYSNDNDIKNSFQVIEKYNNLEVLKINDCYFNNINLDSFSKLLKIKLFNIKLEDLDVSCINNNNLKKIIIYGRESIINLYNIPLSVISLYASSSINIQDNNFNYNNIRSIYAYDYSSFKLILPKCNNIEILCILSNLFINVDMINTSKIRIIKFYNISYICDYQLYKFINLEIIYIRKCDLNYIINNIDLLLSLPKLRYIKIL